MTRSGVLLVAVLLTGVALVGASLWTEAPVGPEVTAPSPEPKPPAAVAAATGLTNGSEVAPSASRDEMEDWVFSARERLFSVDDAEFVRLRILRQEDDARVVGQLCELGSALDPRLRRLAARYLAEAYPVTSRVSTEAERVLRSLSTDREAGIRKLVAKVLGRYDTPFVRDVLGSCLDDAGVDPAEPDGLTVGEVARSMIQALGVLDGDAAYRNACMRTGTVSDPGAVVEVLDAFPDLRLHLQFAGHRPAHSASIDAQQDLIYYSCALRTLNGDLAAMTRSTGISPYGRVMCTTGSMRFQIWVRILTGNRVRYWVLADEENS